MAYKDAIAFKTCEVHARGIYSEMPNNQLQRQIKAATNDYFHY